MAIIYINLTSQLEDLFLTDIIISPVMHLRSRLTTNTQLTHLLKESITDLSPRF